MNLKLVNLIDLLDLLIDKYWELLSGKKTSKIVETFDLLPYSNDSIADAKKYQPVRTRILRHALFEMANIIEANKYTFVDIGCGKGRTAYWAKKYNYRHYIGVDFSPSLIKIAKENYIQFEFDQYVLKDIREYAMPEGQVVFFIFNPFEGETFRLFLEKLKNRSEKTYLIYVNPILDFLISLNPEVKLIKSRTFRNENNNYNIYEL